MKKICWNIMSMSYSVTILGLLNFLMVDSLKVQMG